jgi:hypothetical protein
MEYFVNQERDPRLRRPETFAARWLRSREGSFDEFMEDQCARAYEQGLRDWKEGRRMYDTKAEEQPGLRREWFLRGARAMKRECVRAVTGWPEHLAHELADLGEQTMYSEAVCADAKAKVNENDRDAYAQSLGWPSSEAMNRHEEGS